ncbi:MAG TPA: serine hydrolase domain-containing protein [Gemmatimonadales bacterium]|nr:serine hydrolase domain-containing protein [Gemmatimonadales bacterium]
MLTISRRSFVLSSVAALGLRPRLTWDDLDAFIEAEMTKDTIPGLAAVVVKSGRIAWSRGYGFADIGAGRKMDPAATIQNIGSISKTFTGTAVMQLVERNQIDLDQDVSRYVGFDVRHPSHPTIPITCRLLLTHRSGIIDGDAYEAGYACGDPTTALGDWLREYLTPTGKQFNATDNFGDWQPGSTWKYSNIGFGLLGHIVEKVSGETFRDYTRKHIFEPLGLTNVGWFWSDIDPATHASTYTPVSPKTEKSIAEARQKGLIDHGPEHHPSLGEFQAFCRYNFTNYTDGALRVSANGLARFLIAYVSGGAPLLRPETVRQMLTPAASLSADSAQGLVWRSNHVTSDLRWGHGGADPGIRTGMAFRPSDGVGVIVFVNRGGVALERITDRLFAEAGRL